MQIKRSMRTIGAVAVLAAMIFSAGSALAEKRSWPFNGRVLNRSTAAVTVWSDDRGVYTIPPLGRSDFRNDDVDYIRDIRGQWFKIGPRAVVVNHGGEVSGAQCKTSTYGKDCGQ